MNDVKQAMLWFGVVLVIAGIIFGIRWAMAPTSGALEKRETVYSGEHRITSYEHFYDLCTSIARKKTALKAQERLLSEAKLSNREKSRIRTRIAAIETQLSSNVAKYNNDARKTETKAKFLGKDLPLKIDTRGALTCGR